jgi:hypothetical protein
MNASATMTDATSSRAPSPKAEPATAKSGEAASSDDTPVEAKPSEAAASESKTPEIKTPEIKPAGTDASATEAVKTEEHPDTAKVETKPDDVKTQASKIDAPKSSDKPTEQSNPKPDDSGKAAISKPAPAIAAVPKRSGQIAVFVSRKDSKLYVRQNFSPLFSVPVTIAPSDRPLGTHVFTAQADKDDANVLRWSVVSLPVRVRYAEQRDDDERSLRRRKAGAVEVKSLPMPDSPAEALDRLSIPADAMARITEALSTGGSIIVSDQGINAGETGEGTDFIVSLR